MRICRGALGDGWVRFKISYMMMVGRSERLEVDAKSALSAYREIKLAGGGQIVIYDQGRPIPVDELIAMAISGG